MTKRIVTKSFHLKFVCTFLFLNWLLGGYHDWRWAWGALLLDIIVFVKTRGRA